MKKEKDLKSKIATKKNLISVLCVACVVGVAGLFAFKNYTDNSTYVKYQDKKLNFPLSVKELEETGYKLDCNNVGIKLEDEIPPESVLDVDFPISKGKEISGITVKLRNDSKENIKVKDANIHKMRFTLNDSGFSLKKDIKLGDTFSDIKKVYGKPKSTLQNNGYTTVKYEYSKDSYLTVDIVGDICIAMDIKLKEFDAK